MASSSKLTIKDILSNINIAEVGQAAGLLLDGGQTSAQVADEITDALVAILPLGLAERSIENGTTDPALKAAETAGAAALNLIERPILRFVVGLIVNAVSKRKAKAAA